LAEVSHSVCQGNPGAPPVLYCRQNQKPRKSANMSGVWEFALEGSRPGASTSYPQVINNLWISMEFGEFA